jgi:hypothetical protein
MNGIVSGRMHREMSRLFNIGAIGSISDARLLDRFITAGDMSAEVAFEKLLNRRGPMVLQVCRGVPWEPISRRAVATALARGVQFVFSDRRCQ